MNTTKVGVLTKLERYHKCTLYSWNWCIRSTFLRKYLAPISRLHVLASGIAIKKRTFCCWLEYAGRDQKRFTRNKLNAHEYFLRSSLYIYDFGSVSTMVSIISVETGCQKYELHTCSYLDSISNCACFKR